MLIEPQEVERLQKLPTGFISRHAAEAAHRLVETVRDSAMQLKTLPDPAAFQSALARDE